MTKFSIQTLVFLIATMLTSVLSFAGDGMSSTTPFLVCGKTGFKLTSTVAIPTNGSIQWFKADGTAIANATTIDQTFTAMNTDSTHEILDTLFKVVVYSDLGCPSDSGKIYVRILPPPTLHTEIDNSLICSSNSAATTLHLNANTVGTPTLPSAVTYTYAWTGSSNTNAINTATVQSPTTVPPSTAGAYTYTVAVNYAGLDINTSVSNADGCKSSKGVNVTISTTPTKPNATISSN